MSAAVGQPVNPFRVLGPLCPWDDLGHYDYYVSVDRTQRSFDEFTVQLSGDVGSVLKQGRMVITLGDEGCGKSSLNNRCVAWLSNRLTELDITPLIVDLTMLTAGNAPVATVERMRQVCEALIDQLEVDRRLDGGVLAELRSRQEAPDKMYHYLSLVLTRIASSGPNLALLVLLPSADLAPEIVKYVSLVRPRLVFFAESSTLKPDGSWQSGLDRLGKAPPIMLSVGQLGPEDGWRYVEHRLRRHDSTVQVPSLHRETMARVVQPGGPSVTIARLARLLFGVYEAVLASPAPPPEVTFADITNFFYEHSTR